MSKTNLIYLEPLGGLANRLRVIATGLSLKQQLGCKLVVIWNENYELNCPWDKLFEPIYEITFIKKKRWFRYAKRSTGANLKERLINRLLGLDYRLTEEDFPQIDIYSKIKLKRNIFISTSQCLNDSLDFYSFFKPVTYLRDKIDGLVQLFSINTIGVQVRRSDNTTSTINSPLKLFITQMQLLQNDDPDILFFLTTDDAKTEIELKEIFGNKILTRSRELSRQTVTGMQDAVVDLFILSKTKVILGSYWSSFSEVASCLSKTPLKVIKSK